MNYDKLCKHLVVMILITTTFLFYIITTLIYSFRIRMPLESYDEVEAQQLCDKAIDKFMCFEEMELTKSGIKELVQSILKPKLYLEFDVGWLNCEGRTSEPLRIVFIASNLKNYSYCYVLTHEYIHLTYSLGDERLTDYLTTIILWESDIPYLMKAACYTVWNNIKYHKRDAYDCTAQLIEYFRNKW